MKRWSGGVVGVAVDSARRELYVRWRCPSLLLLRLLLLVNHLHADPSRRLAGCPLQRLPALNLLLQLVLARQGVRCALGRYMAHKLYEHSCYTSPIIATAFLVTMRIRGYRTCR